MRFNRIKALLASAVLGALPLSAAAQPFFSEIFADAPGADQGQEFIEIQGQPGTALGGLFILVIEGDGGSGGVVDQVIPLDGLALGANGLLLIRDSAVQLLPPPDAGTTIVVRDFVPDIENGTQTYVLLQGQPPAVGTDLDFNNDGVLDAPFAGTVLDAVSYVEAGTGVELDYADDLGGTSIPQQIWTPDALVRLVDDAGGPAGLPLNSWSALDVVGVAPGPYVADPLENLGLSYPEIDISQFRLTPGSFNFVFQRGACCTPTSCAVAIRPLCAATFLPGAGCSPNPCPPTTGACCLAGGGCTITQPGFCVGNFFPGLSCGVAPCFDPPVIFDVFPQNPEPFEEIVITGNNFGNNPDNICAVVGFPDGRLVPIDIFEVTPNQARGFLAPTDDDGEVGVPGQVMLMVGEGNRGPFRPAFFDIFVEEPNDTWVWRTDNPAMAVAPQPIVLRPTPIRPRTFYIHGRINDGKLCIFLDPNNPWMTNSKITLWNRLHGTQNGTDFRFRDLKTCVRFRLPNNTLACAQRLCDVMRCAFGQQTPPILIDCQVIPQPDGRVKIEVALPNGVITKGTFKICVEKARMVPTQPRNWPITGFGGVVIDDLVLPPLVSGFDANGGGFTVDEIPNDGRDGIEIELEPMLLTGGRGLHLAAWGRAGGMEDQLLGTARLEPHTVDSFFDIWIDFAPIGGNNVRVVGINGNAVVADYVAPSGNVGRLMTPNIDIRGCGKVPPRIPPVWCFWIDPRFPLPLLPPGATVPVQITELRLLAVNPAVPIEALRQFDIGSNLPPGMPPMPLQVIRADTFPTLCPADVNADGLVTVQDIFDFLAFYFSNDPRADVNGSGSITVQDIFDFLAAYFRPCP